jgi:phosphatidylserine decarboxylase
MPDLRRCSSSLIGWLADRHVPRPLRAGVYGLYCRATGARADEAELAPEAYPSLGAFFVRRLKPGARSLEPDARVWGSPCDGTLQALDRIERGGLLQAKGRSYSAGDLVGTGASEALEGAWVWTIYLAPRDYHRVHVPAESRLLAVRWIDGARRSVAPAVLAREDRVLATNERAVLELQGPTGPYVLVMVGALNVGRIRVVGVDPGTSPSVPRALARGAELARFEMGSTVVLIVPHGVAPVPGLAPGQPLRLHQRIGTSTG